MFVHVAAVGLQSRLRRHRGRPADRAGRGRDRPATRADRLWNPPYSGCWSDEAPKSASDYIAWNHGLQPTLDTLIANVRVAVAECQVTEDYNTMGSCPVRLFRSMSIALTGFLLVAGCGIRGTPLAASPASDTPPSPTSTSTAPEVPNPLDVTKLFNDPCGAFTAGQLTPYVGAIRGTSGKQTAVNIDVNCVWDPVDNSQPDISVIVYPNLGGPQNLDVGLFPWHERTADIAGYPAEHESLNAGGPSTGSCRSLIAVSDKAAIGVAFDTVTASQQYYAKSCEPTDALLIQLVARVRAGG